jgi:acetolactate synthase-1/2/3 large subunit
MVRQWQQSYYEERYAHSSMANGMPDFVKLVNSYGIKAFNITTFDELLEKQEEIFLSNYPVVVNFAVEEKENCYPMVQPGKSNSQMIGLNRELE